MPDGVERRYRRLFSAGDGVERIAAYSDGVYAIAMTLLVLNLHIPTGTTSAFEVLVQEWPSYLGFALSFVIIAVSWVGHHRRFRVVTGHDTGLIVVNLVLLFFVVSLPFPTSLISEFAPETSAVIVYAAAVGLLEVAELVEWVYLRRRGLMRPEVDEGVYRYVLWSFVPTIVVFLGSIVVALLAGGVPAMVSWWAIAILSPFIGRISARRIDRSAGPR